MREELEKKVERAIRFLKSIDKIGGGKIEVAYSGGKDSDIILQLAKEAGINYEAIYKNTTIDPPGTIKHAKENGCTIIQPNERFFEIIRKYGVPNRYQRFCCGRLKEYKVLDKAIIGVRKAESVKRAKRYTEPEQCRVYSKKKGDSCRQYFPILEWTDQDVEEFIADRKIKCHPLYYDENGKFHVERRLGCQGCPIVYRKKRIEFFKNNPKWLKAWIKSTIIFWNSHPDNKMKKYFNNVYEKYVCDLFFYTIKDFQNERDGNMFVSSKDYKKFLEDYFNISLP